jgi:hypothetical protein
MMVSVFYLVPLLGTAGAIAVLMGYSPTSILARRQLRAAA